jgi:hypothetical protein
MAPNTLRVTTRYYALRPLAWLCSLGLYVSVFLFLLGPREQTWYCWFYAGVGVVPLLLLLAAYLYWRRVDPRRAHIW